MRIAVIADSHVSIRAPECLHNWHAAAAAVAAVSPVLTVHLGDISLDAERTPADLDCAAQLVAQWPTPIGCVPGNHDMGTGSGEAPLSMARLQRHVELLGPDRWVLHFRPWHLFGLNAQLLGSGTREEVLQWEWLEHHAAALREGERAIVLLHRPLVRPSHDAGMPSGRYVAPQAAQRLLEGPLRRALRLVLSGHTHQALDFTVQGVRHIWVPSNAFIVPDTMQAPIGDKLLGVGLLTLSDDGVNYELLRPPGLQRHELTGLACFGELAH